MKLRYKTREILLVFLFLLVLQGAVAEDRLITTGLYAVLGAGNTEAIYVEGTTLYYRGNKLTLRIAASTVYETKGDYQTQRLTTVRVYNERNTLVGSVQNNNSSTVVLSDNATVIVDYEVYSTYIPARTPGWDLVSTGQYRISCIKANEAPVVTLTGGSAEVYSRDSEVTISASASSSGIPIDGSSWARYINNTLQSGSGSSITLRNEGNYYLLFSVKNRLGVSASAGSPKVSCKSFFAAAFPAISAAE